MGEREEEERGETDLHLLIILRTQPVIFLTLQQTIWCGLSFGCNIIAMDKGHTETMETFLCTEVSFIQRFTKTLGLG